MTAYATDDFAERMIWLNRVKPMHSLNFSPYLHTDRDDGRVKLWLDVERGAVAGFAFGGVALCDLVDGFLYLSSCDDYDNARAMMDARGLRDLAAQAISTAEKLEARAAQDEN